MKTFEERYTAWIDGQLEGPALTAFELELSRRASAGEARTDKADAARLRGLLKTGLQAPVLTNVEFFSHQLSERIAAERNSERRQGQPRAERNPLFAWSFGRLAGLGTAFLFFAVALYYGLMPEGMAPYRGPVAKTTGTAPAVAVAESGTSAPVIPEITALEPRDPSQPVELAKLDPADLPRVQVADQSKDTTTATSLHYEKPDVNVIWINGLDYLPTVPDETAANSDGNDSSRPAPVAAGTAQP